MHIDFLQDDGVGRTVLEAVRGADDRALAVDRLILDAPPRSLGQDRLAVAGVLLFGDRAESQISFPGEISYELAEVVQEICGLRVNSEVARPKGASEQSGDEQEAPLQVTTLTVGQVTGFSERTPEVDETRLGLVPGERFQGALFGIKEAIIPSNAWLFTSVTDPAAVLLAAGLLYSEDFLARALRVELADSSAGTVPEAARKLCAAVGLDVS